MINGSPGFLKGTIASSSKTSLRSPRHSNQSTLSNIDDDVEDSTESFSLPSSGSAATLAEKSLLHCRQEPLGSGISDGLPTLRAIKREPLQSNLPSTPLGRDFKESYSSSPLHQNDPHQCGTSEELLEYEDSIRELRRANTRVTKVTSEGFTALKKIVTENFRILSHRLEALTLQQQHLQLQQQDLSACSISTSSLSHHSQIDSDRITMLEQLVKQLAKQTEFRDQLVQQSLERVQIHIEDVEKELLAMAEDMAEATKTGTITSEKLTKEATEQVQTLKKDLEELTDKFKRDVWYLDDVMTDFERQLRLVKRKVHIEDDYGDTSSDGEKREP
jgi:ABC-type phosphate transport system auxiliary subunit